jgi:hypothetical protein
LLMQVPLVAVTKTARPHQYARPTHEPRYRHSGFSAPGIQYPYEIKPIVSMPENKNGRQMPGSIHLPGWVGLLQERRRIGLRVESLTPWQSSVSAGIHCCTTPYHAKRNGVNCNCRFAAARPEFSTFIASRTEVPPTPRVPAKTTRRRRTALTVMRFHGPAIQNLIASGAFSTSVRKRAPPSRNASLATVLLSARLSLPARAGRPLADRIVNFS